MCARISEGVSEKESEQKIERRRVDGVEEREKSREISIFDFLKDRSKAPQLYTYVYGFNLHLKKRLFVPPLWMNEPVINRVQRR